MSSGAAKSGKPCDRLTAPYFSASRVISRITDSVNRLALRDTWRLREGVGVVIGHEKVTQNRGTDERGLTCVHSRKSAAYLRDDLFARGFAFQLFEDGANRGGITAVWRQLQVFLVRGDGFFRLLDLFVRRAEHLVDDWFAVGKLVQRLFVRDDSIGKLTFIFQHARHADVSFGLNAAAFFDGTSKGTNRLVTECFFAIDATF